MTGSWIELDRECLLSNLETFRLRLGNPALMAVVKANAYGHGAALIAPVIRDHVDWFAVDALAEAEELRALEKPVLILGHTDTSEAERLVELGFRQVLFRRDVAEALSKAAVTLGRPARVHLKIETVCIASGSAWMSSKSGRRSCRVSKGSKWKVRTHTSPTWKTRARPFLELSLLASRPR